MSPEEEKVINRNTMKLQDHLYKALKQRDQYKAERDTLIDDIKNLRERKKQLEENNYQLNEIFNYQENKKKEYFNEIVKLEKENKTFLKQMDRQTEKIKELEEEDKTSYKPYEVFKLKQENERLERENEKLRNNYNSLTQHIRQKAEANPSEHRYIALVNFVDRLER